MRQASPKSLWWSGQPLPFSLSISSPGQSRFPHDASTYFGLFPFRGGFQRGIIYQGRRTRIVSLIIVQRHQRISHELCWRASLIRPWPGLLGPVLRKDRPAMSVPPIRPRKHKKGPSSGPDAARPEESRIFEPFRNLGRVTSGVAPAFYVQAGLPYLTTALGRTFQTFDVRCIFLKRDGIYKLNWRCRLSP